MDVRGKRGKIFGTIILILMTVLALSTITLAAGRSSGSYSLTIHKIANVEGELPEGVTLAGRECKFRVEGILGGRGGTEGTPFTKEVTVTLDENGEGSTKVDLGSPGSISVVELNPNTANTLLTNAVALTEISNESHMHVNSSNPKAEIDLSKENSWITIKPDEPGTQSPVVKRAYKITKDGNEHQLLEIEDGQLKKIENLAPGHYTIEAQKAPAGFGLLVTNPCIESEAGKELTVNIDSNSGEGLLTTADDGNTHYFKVKGPNGYEDSFVLPYKDESGNQQFSYKVQHVVEGQYTMQEESYEGQAAFKVYAPKTTYTTQATKNYTFQSGYYSVWPTTKSNNNNDYIRLVLYEIKGPAAGNKFWYRVNGELINKPSDGKTYADANITKFNPEAKYLAAPITYTVPGKNIKFKFYDNAGVTGCKIDIRLYQPRVYYYNSNEGTDKIVTVDDRRYIEIEKPNDSGAQAGQVTYYFTISDKDGNVVTVTDSNGSSMTEVEVAPGKRLKVNVPAAGNYTVHQEMKKISPAPFTVSTKCQQSTILQNATLTASIAGTGSTIQMSKPACDDGIDDLGREYHFRVTGPSLPADGVVVALKAGENFKLRDLLVKAGHTVPENYVTGKYSISAIDGGYAGFDLTYSDSCTLDVVSSSATVTVTNTYKKAFGAYRVVHEYYDGDVSTPDAENFDGRSEISLFGNENIYTEHTGDEITKEYLYQKDDVKYTYEYVDTVYGNYGEFVEDASTPTPTPSPTSEPDSALVSDEEGKENENEKEDGESNGELAESPQPVSTPDSSPDPEDGNQGEEGKEDSGQDGDNQENGSQEKDDQEHDGQDGNSQEGEGGNDSQEDINTESSAPVPAFVPVLKTDIISVQNMAYKMEPMTIRLKAETVLYGEMPKDGAESRNMDNKPTEQPKPTPEPTLESDPKPTPEPTSEPTIEPTAGPATEPTAEPTPGPAIEPTVEPTGEPADEPKPEESPVPGKEEQEAEKIGQNEINAEISGDIMLLNDTSDKIFVDTGEYAMDEGMTCAVAKPHGDNIIILRYKRVKKQEETTGSYHIVHRYYHRTPQGDIFEGAYDEGVIDAPLDFSKQYTADTVEKRLKHTPPQNLIPNAVPHTYTYEFSVYGYYKPSGNGEPAAYEDGYRPIDGKECAYATENGEEAIVLRYYRNEAAYNVVHEYYLRTPVDISTSSTTLNGDSAAGSSEGADNEGSSDGSEGSDFEDGDGSDIAYNYKFEGNTDVTMHTGILNDTYTGLRVEQIPEHASRIYTHFRYDYGKLKADGKYEDIDGKNSVTATMEADEVIILRYYREVGGPGTPTPTPPPTNPRKPEHPKPTDEPAPPDEPEPTEAPQPTGSPKPTGSPTPGKPSPSPENPGYPTELPDPNDPDSPEEITIWEDGVPKTYVKLWNPEIEEWVYILDSEIPLWYFPDTGDGSGIGFWAVMCII